jgi:hypothetical protein
MKINCRYILREIWITYLIRLISERPAAICAGNLGLICTTEPPIAGPRINPKLFLDPVNFENLWRWLCLKLIDQNSKVIKLYVDLLRTRTRRRVYPSPSSAVLSWWHLQLNVIKFCNGRWWVLKWTMIIVLSILCLNFLPAMYACAREIFPPKIPSKIRLKNNMNGVVATTLY